MADNEYKTEGKQKLKNFENLPLIGILPPFSPFYPNKIPLRVVLCEKFFYLCSAER